MTRRRSIFSAAVIGAALTSLLLSGCATGQSTASAGSDTPVEGGNLVHAVTAIADGWQQQQSNNWYKSQVWTQLVETLVYVDDTGEVHPWLAESWEESDDGLQYTLKLRDDVTFSDGTALTADVVAKNLEVLGLGDESKGITRSPIVPGEFASAEAVDDSTVLVTLKSPNRGFIPSLGFFAAGILGESTLDLPLEDQADLENVVGTGPFVFESQVPEREIVLTKRDDYNWASEAFEHEGPAYLDSITFNVLEEDSARQGALEAGQVDSVHFVQPSEEQRLIDDGFNVIYGEYLGTPINFVLRPNAEITNDVNVRQAIQHGVNRQEIVDTVFNSNWKPATSSVQAATPGWVDLSENLAFDQELSNSLLDESGWTEKDAEGYRVKAGTRLTIPAYTSPFVNGSGQILELAAQQLKAVGIELEIRQTDASTYSDIFAAGGTPIFPVANSFLDATTLRQYWGQDYTNQFQLKNGELEEQLLGVSETANGTDERAANLAKLQETVLEEAYTVPIVDNYQVFVTSLEVHGIETNAVGRPYFYDTWIGQ